MKGLLVYLNSFIVKILHTLLSINHRLCHTQISSNCYSSHPSTISQVDLNSPINYSQTNSPPQNPPTQTPSPTPQDQTSSDTNSTTPSRPLAHTSPPQTPPAAHIAKTHTDAARYRVEGRVRCSSRRRGLLVAELRMRMKTAKMENMGSVGGGGLAGSSEGLGRGWGGRGRGRLCRGIWLCRFCRWCWMGG